MNGFRGWKWEKCKQLPARPKINCATGKEGRNRLKFGGFLESSFQDKKIHKRHIISSFESAICKLSKDWFEKANLSDN